MINIENLYKSYGKQCVLSNLNLKVETGKINAVLGTNGAGKSSLINIMSGIILPDSGKILIENVEIKSENPGYKIFTGFVFENPVYVEVMSVKEYLTFAAQLYRIPKNERAERVNYFINFFELPVDKKRISTFSHGMQKKVSIATSLLHNPRYLILDEPFNGLDFLSSRKLITLLKEKAAQGTTILLTSHQFDLISEACDKFALLKDGEIKFNVDFSELEKMSADFCNEKVPVKSYLESIMQSKIV